MTRRPPKVRVPIRQLSLYLATLAAPPLEGATRDTVVQLLARLLTSACIGEESPEGRDETR